MGEGFVDLHVHSNKSDGTWPPSEMVSAAKAAGLRAIALTDHDTIEGLAEAHSAAAKAGIEVIDGVELSADLMGSEVHILGYMFNRENRALQSLFKRMQKERASRIKKMVKKLQCLGYKIEFCDVKSEAMHAIMTRPHVARVLLKKGYVNSVKEAFVTLIGNGKPAYVPRPKLTVVQAIKIIRKAEGIPVVAHPALAGTTIPFRELVDAGLLGIEVYHADHDATDITNYLSIASYYGLVSTGGSDSHGPHSSHGHGLGKPRIPYEVVHRLHTVKAQLSSVH